MRNVVSRLNEMNDMKKINFMTLCLLFGCIACQQPTKSGDEGTAYKSQSYKLVEENIMKMASKPWSKATFSEIKDKQIPMLKKNSERISATTLLETEYSKLLVRDAKGILETGCPDGNNSHKLLGQLLSELKAYPKVPGLTEIKSAKQLHDEASRFTQIAVGRQSISNYRTSYNRNHETRRMAEAQKYLDNAQLKCKSIRNRLDNLTRTSAYQSRRRAYCEAIVESYLECTDPAKSELNAAKANISVYTGSTTAWKEMMDEHYEELNKEEEDEHEKI